MLQIIVGSNFQRFRTYFISHFVKKRSVSFKILETIVFAKKYSPKVIKVTLDSSFFHWNSIILASTQCWNLKNITKWEAFDLALSVGQQLSYWKLKELEPWNFAGLYGSASRNSKLEFWILNQWRHVICDPQSWIGHTRITSKNISDICRLCLMLSW